MKDYSTKVRLTIDFDVDVRAQDEDSACYKASEAIKDWFCTATHKAKYALDHELEGIEIIDINELGPDVMKASHQQMEDSQ